MQQRRLANGGKFGYDCINGMALAKNIMTVGAVDGILRNDSLVYIMPNFSSWGPSDDGRIKPDICGDGVNVLSCGDEHSKSYYTNNGTSMASPNVAGSLLLLQELYYQKNKKYIRSATLKGLAIHTATCLNAESRPDYRFGWGILNSEKAAKTILEVGKSSEIIEAIITESDTIEYNVKPSTYDSIIVITLSWTDPPGKVSSPVLNSRESKLVNDLDIMVSSGSSIYYPYTLDPNNPEKEAQKGINSVDNIEKIYIKLDHKNSTYVGRCCMNSDI